MKTTFPREFYIPKGATAVSDEQSDAVAYVYAREGKLFGLMFLGKQAKPIWHFRFLSEKSRNEKIQEGFTNRRRTLGYKAERAAERKAWKNDYQVGEILNTCWGYDQTNREYFEIVALKGKASVVVRQIACESYATSSMSENVIPMPGQYVGEPITARATANGVHVFPGSDYRTAHRTHFTMVAGIKVYSPQHTSSWA